MRLRTVGLAAALSASLFQTSDAVVQPKGAEAPVVSAGRAPRMHRTTSWSRDAQLAALGLPGWTAIWDRDTDVPLRLWGSGVSAPGAMRDPQIAEAAARQFLIQHLRVLAPGSSAADFTVVANQLGGAGDVRSVGFQQTAGGVRVLGGTIGMSFKNDRLIMVGSTALPNVSVAAATTVLDRQRIATSAIGWLATDGYPVRVTSAAEGRVIVPIVRPRSAGGTGVTYHLAEQVTVESTTSDVGRWTVWLDASTASPIARKTTIHYASGRVLFDVPDRSPSGTRSAKVVARASHLVNGIATMSGADGTVTWADGIATVAPGLRGSLIAVTNKAGSLAMEMLQLADGGDLVWSKATEEFNDAQLSAFVFASTAKDYAKTYLNPTLPWLDETLSVTVNENNTCNAYSTGDDIHFYKARFSNDPVATGNCQNTARLADVVYHEFGHSLHANSIIDGVGMFDGALSEGMSDMLAAFITKDHGMGRGFFFGDAPLRDLDPASDKRWPDDVTGEVHDDGEIIGGTLWDLRKALVAKHGEEAGDVVGRKIFYGILQRASDIPSTYAEALVSDDDDGDLGNGTPNQCEINAAFGAHGLADPRITLGLGAPTREGMTISMTTNPPSSSSACPGPGVASAVVDWKVRGGEVAKLDLALTDSTYRIDLPKQPTGTVVLYSVTITLSDGAKITFPNNAADPFYEMYVGEVEPLWCADFETGGDEWLHGATPANRDEWQVGAPQGLGGDPKTAHGGSNVLGIDLDNDGVYRRSSALWAESPVIDLQGNTGNIRVQYYRWLGVEDGFFDTASVVANGTKVWGSYSSPEEPESPTNHIDKEWRFHDIDVSGQVADGKLTLRFELASDPGFSLSGWNIDDLCVVIAKPGPACEADDSCDEIADTGCCSIGGSPQGALALSVLTLGAVLRRRRRR
jgi:hypothetical protein